MPVATIEWKNNRLKIVDQSALPHRLRFLYCDSLSSVWRAIRHLKIRGAPALGVCAAYGVYLGVRNAGSDLFVTLDRVIKYLSTARPTARNLFWALERMKEAAYLHRGEPAGKIKAILLKEAHKIFNEDKGICRKMARFGNGLVKDGDKILTHCNAGGLATADYGTALGVLFAAKRSGKKIAVYADETRPVLQGARLTAWELLKEGIDTTLICDNMAATLMAQGRIDKVFVGADRIAGNGDTANKIGTYSLAVLAHYHEVPFYVVAPLSTIDVSLKNGTSIPIEERAADEVRKVGRIYTAPRQVRVFNPAFDVTPSRFITAIVTEKGILRRPFSKSIPRIFR